MYVMNYMRYFGNILALMLFITPGFSASGDNNILEEALDSFSANKIREHIEILGGDSLMGRGTGQRGAEMAAEYLANQFSELDLKPAADNGTFYQRIPMHSSSALAESEMFVATEDDTLDFDLGSDYLLLKTGDQTFTPDFVELVFAGYGIIAPEFDYNDYLTIDVEGKIAVVIEGEPVSDDPDFFGGELPTIYSYAESKIRLALARGAAGCIVIPNVADKRIMLWEEIRRNFSFEKVTLAYTVSSGLSILMNPFAATHLFGKSKFSLNEIYQKHLKGTMESFPLKTKLSFEGKFRRNDFISSNIIGMIRGSDPDLRNSYIAVSAHYDHLGTGPEMLGDSIYNGVLDNAIGVAGLLEIARIFRNSGLKPKRSIIFLLTTGEEKGLLGSQYYVDHPPFPLYKTVANVNIDGLNFIGKMKTIIGIGSELSTLENFLEKAAAAEGLELTGIPPQFEQFEAFSMSDQMSFAKAGIPAILVYEGAKYENLEDEETLSRLIDYSSNIYHTPFDDLTIDIDYEGAIQHLRVIFRLINSIANSEESPEWQNNTPYINERLRSRAEKR